MGNYISSNANRFYVAKESAYGQAAAITADNRFAAIRLQAQQVLEPSKRFDKTGSRTFLGTSSSARRRTAFETRAYLPSLSASGTPMFGPLVEAALGGAAQTTTGATIATVENTLQMQTTAPHGLAVGSGVSFGNEIRFVVAVPDASTLTLNAPFSNVPAAGSTLGVTCSYGLSTTLPSVTLYDYWDPTSAVSRIVTGAAVDVFQVAVNGDYHELTFSGPAADLLDSSSFAQGMAGLAGFPVEPTLQNFNYTFVPGHLGEAWLGSSPNEFFTMTNAAVQVRNNLAVRNFEFGSSYPRAVVPGPREVTCSFSLYAKDDAQTTALYQAAKQRTPVAAMLQLGQQQGQMMGIYLPNFVPEIPNYNDSDTRLIWEFKNNVAQGNAEDEIYIAFA